MRLKSYFLVLLCVSISLFSAEHVYLKTPDLSKENILGVGVGIRPYRKTGIRLEAEYMQNKCIIHNYGYGGSGLTLCFGGSQEVLRILKDENLPSQTVAILGAGVVGLATAYDLLEEGYDVHIYSDSWSPHLTSDVALGIWSPPSIPEDFSEEKKHMLQRMLNTSEQRFISCLSKPHKFAGVRFIEAYSLLTSASTLVWEDVVIHFDNGLVKEGGRRRMIGIDGKVFMEDLYAKVQAKGAILQERHFEHLESVLSLGEPIIINCTSMGSRELFHDRDFVPVRGQLVYFKPQEGVDYFLSQKVLGPQNFWVNIYPWSDRMIIGSNYEKSEDRPVINPEITDRLIENAKKCLSGEL